MKAGGEATIVPGSRADLSDGYLTVRAEEPPGKCPLGSPSAGKSQAESSGARLAPSGAVFFNV